MNMVGPLSGLAAANSTNAVEKNVAFKGVREDLRGVVNDTALIRKAAQEKVSTPVAAQSVTKATLTKEQGNNFDATV